MANKSVPSSSGGEVRHHNRRPTIKDVAELSGVSRSTASRALTGNGYVAAPVRSRVEAAAKKLRYVPDAMARHLRQQDSRTIGVLVSDLSNPFYAEMASGVGHAARLAGYTMFLADDAGFRDLEIEAARTFVALRVAGVIITPISKDAISFLTAHDMPVVEVDRQFSDGTCDSVVVDNRVGAHELSRHLIELGHRRIALMVDETDWTTGRDRHQGYQSALVDMGLEVNPDLIVSAGWNVQNAQQVALKLLDSENPPTAIFTANNVLAEGAYRAIRELELSVPEDLSLVSFDDVPWMSMVSPGITAVAQDPSEIGAAAVERLSGRIANPDTPVRTVVLPARVLSRGSTGHPRQ